MKRIVYEADNGWCYNILTDIGDLQIHQDVKPAVSGINGFKTKAEAEHIADLVVALIEAKLPPSVTIAQVTNAKGLDINSELKAIKEATTGTKKEEKPKNMQ